MKIRVVSTLSFVFLFWSSANAAGDPANGKRLFKERCSVCHSAEAGDGGGAQGPSLTGVMGRLAASSPQFSYSAALRQSRLTWDSTTLDHFLAAPGTLVPGTAMVIAVDNASDRSDLIGYLQSLPKAAPVRNDPDIAVPNQSRISADWKLDTPGRIHHIAASSLPAPFATKSFSNQTRVVDKPTRANLSLPPGFHLDTFASGLVGPRKMVAAANGDIFVTETVGGRVSILHPSADGTRSTHTDTFVSGLKEPFGILFYPNAQAPQWVYVAETHRVIRYAYRVGDTVARGAAEVVVPEIPGGAGHYTRDIAFSADGKRLWVSVGSASNVAESMSKKTPQQLETWEQEHGLGAAWDLEDHRAAILEFDVANPGKPRTYATGIRNCVGLTVQPGSERALVHH